MKNTFSIMFLLLGTILSWAQAPVELPYIEVTGIAEEWFDPNEIHISVKIMERMDGKEKLTLASQENSLVAALKAQNLPQLQLRNTSANYVNIKRHKDQHLTEAYYTIVVSNATEVGAVFDILEDLHIQQGYIQKVTHTDLEELQKEMRIKAIKAAKTKAQYLTSSIDITLGKVLVIRESAGTPYYANVMEKHAEVMTASDEHYSAPSRQITFKKIKITSQMYLKIALVNP